jgi:hypothetical protein
VAGSAPLTWLWIWLRGRAGAGQEASMPSTKLLWILFLLAACDGDEPPTCEGDGGQACFRLPTDVVTAYDPADALVGTPQRGCGLPYYAPAAAGTVLTGTVADWSATGIGDVSLSLYPTAAYATPFATTTTAADGSYSVAIPAGSPGIVFSETSGPGRIVVRQHMAGIDYTRPRGWGSNTHAEIDQFLEPLSSATGVAWEPGLAAADIHAYDCSVNHLEHVAIVVSSTSGTRTFVAGAITSYASATGIPEAFDAQPETTRNGSAYVLLPPGTYYAQLWAFVDAAALARGAEGLTLLGEQPFTAQADARARLDTWTE